MEDWLDLILGSSEMLQDFYMQSKPDDASGWGKKLDQIWFEKPGARPTGTGVLITGPEGSGKHTAAMHLIRRLTERDYSLAVLRGADLTPETGGFPELRRRLNSLLDHYLDAGQALCLLAEDLMHSAYGKACAQYLGDMLCFYYLRRKPDFAAGGPRDAGMQQMLVSAQEQYAPLFLICIEKKAAGLPAQLRTRLQHCRLTLPNELQRTAFLRNHPVRYIPDMLSADEFIQRTKGLSYSAMEDLVQDLNYCPNADRHRLRLVLDSYVPQPTFHERLLEMAADISDALRQNPAGIPVRTGQPEIVNAVGQETNALRTRAEYDKDSGSVLLARLPEEQRRRLDAVMQKAKERA